MIREEEDESGFAPGKARVGGTIGVEGLGGSVYRVMRHKRRKSRSRDSISWHRSRNADLRGPVRRRRGASRKADIVLPSIEVVVVIRLFAIFSSFILLT